MTYAALSGGGETRNEGADRGLCLGTATKVEGDDFLIPVGGGNGETMSIAPSSLLRTLWISPTCDWRSTPNSCAAFYPERIVQDGSTCMESKNLKWRVHHGFKNLN